VLLVKPADLIESLVQPAGLVDVDARDTVFIRSFASELGSVDIERLALSRIRKTVGKEATFDVDVVRGRQDEFRDNWNLLGVKEVAVFVIGYVLRRCFPFNAREVHIIAIQRRYRRAVVVVDRVVTCDLLCWCLRFVGIVCATSELLARYVQGCLTRRDGRLRGRLGTRYLSCTLWRRHFEPAICSALLVPRSAPLCVAMSCNKHGGISWRYPF